MNIFFDVDFTILSMDHTLRRGTHHVFGHLVDDGHKVFVWSGKGARWGVVRQHQLEPYLSGVFAKPLDDFDAALRWLRVSPTPDFVIDDYAEIVCHFGGYHIPEFYHARDDDDELQAVYEVVTEWTANGQAAHPRWRPRSQPFGAGPDPDSISAA